MDDFAAHVGMSAEPSRAAPHAARWYRHVAGILDDRFPGDAAGLTVKAALAGGAKPSYTVDWPMMDKARKNGLDAKKIKAANKEGGKKGVEIEGAADMGGLEFFCTRIQAAEVRRKGTGAGHHVETTAVVFSSKMCFFSPPF